MSESSNNKLFRTRSVPRKSPLPVIQSAPEHRYLPFPLTDIQQAYWIGRGDTFPLGKVSTHFYLEIDCSDLDIDRLNLALQKLIDRHDMLRAVILPSGQQQVLERITPYEIEVRDLRGESVSADPCA